MSLTKTIFDKHVKNGGGSTRPDGTTPTTGYAVGLPWTSYTQKGNILYLDDITSFLRSHARTLNNKFGGERLVIGTWYDADTDTSWLDLSVIVQSKDAALLMGFELNQLAIYDFFKGEVVTVGVPTFDL